MKISILLTTAFFLFSFTFAIAQIEQINLEQVKGEFSTTSLDLAAGDYQFNISNNNVGHEVGFVLVPKGSYDQKNHIKDAYVKAPVATGSKSLTNVVNLTPGEYEYFCPLNPTPKYSLTVHKDVEPLRLTQVDGAFKVQALTVSEGLYQFEIANDDVDHEVGFVLVPKGKYDQKNHIKEAYVKAPVATGSASKTNIVKLEAGEYEYFCPLNPTPKYTLKVVN